jgi:lactate permease
MQLLLLAWAFSAFLQGVAGFGVPIAVVAPLLIGLGFPPVVAVAAVAIGHSWSVTFGDIASSFQALMAATGLPGPEIAPWASALLGVACFGCGIAAAWTFRGWQSVRQGWLAVLLMGVVMAVVQASLAVSGLWNLAGFCAGLAGLAVGAGVARLPRYQQAAREDDKLSGIADRSDPSMTLRLALAPYVLLILVVGAAELWPGLHGLLNQVKIRVQFPEVSTIYGWTTPAGTGRTISIFGHAGALLAYVSLVSFLLYRRTGHYTVDVVRRIAHRTVKSAVPSSIGIASMVGFAVAMDHAGMTYVLARGLSQVAGPYYPLVSPFIGLLGAFMTGSNTNSNVVFAPLQQQAAILLQISVPLILGAQTTGGSLGSMLAPAKVIVGCSTAGLAGQEGQVLKRTLGPGLLIAGIVGVLAWIAVWAGWG